MACGSDVFKFCNGSILFKPMTFCSYCVYTMIVYVQKLNSLLSFFLPKLFTRQVYNYLLSCRRLFTVLFKSVVIEINKGNVNTNLHQHLDQSANPPLSNSFGEYCSFCLSLW